MIKGDDAAAIIGGFTDDEGSRILECIVFLIFSYKWLNSIFGLLAPIPLKDLLNRLSASVQNHSLRKRYSSWKELEQI